MLFPDCQTRRHRTKRKKSYAKGSCSQAGRLQLLASKSNRLSDFYVKLTTKISPAANGVGRLDAANPQALLFVPLLLGPQAAPASHFDRSAGALENAEIHNERLTGQCFLDPRAKRGGSCPTTDPEITEKLGSSGKWGGGWFACDSGPVCFCSGILLKDIYQ